MNMNHILIVDVTLENLTVLRKILSERGFKERVATSGELALKTVQRDLPDLLLNSWIYTDSKPCKNSLKVFDSLT